ncbi:peroxidase-related enzyme [Rhodovulum sp. DZ06]|uniref:peroxidase-related enzyme n=1 Tax=Rhodovulum sp. DZ06 TaxID=3425126 RepID=UPI003D345BBA
MTTDPDRQPPELPDGPPTALDLPPADPLPEDTAKYFAVCQDKLGMVPNVLRAYAFAPEKLRAFSGMYNDLMLAPSGLTKLEREMIAVAVSSINKCFYCLTAHGAAVRELSGDPKLGELMVMNWRAAALSERHRAMLLFAEKMTERSHKIEEEDRDALREAGFTDADIFDIASVAGFFNMTNRVASATDMRPNDDYHAQAR